jgi:hypothetical protein
MLTPTWITDGLAVVMLVVAAYCASRLLIARLAHRPTHYSFDAVHTGMGVAMAGMLTSRLTTTTPWVVLFAAAAGWFGIRAASGLRGAGRSSISVGSYLRHLVTSGAMIYMLIATPAVASAGTPAAMSTAHVAGGVPLPTLALLLGVFMVGYTVMVMDRLSRAATGSGPEPAAVIFAPGTVACCQVAMNLTMGYMLLTLL